MSFNSPDHHSSYNYTDDKAINFRTFINPSKNTRYLLIIVAVLVGLSIVGHLALYCLPDFPIRDVFVSKFAVNEEQNFPTLYSSLALFYCATLFGLIAYLKANLKKNETRAWKALSIIFIYLSIDELLSLHEKLSKPLHGLGVNGVLHNAWVVPGIIAILIFLISFYKFFLTLPKFLKRLILIAIFLWVGGAIFVETVGGYYKYLHGEENLGYALITTVEEIMEMLGVVVLIHGLLLYIEKMGYHQISFIVNSDQSQVTNSEFNESKV